MQQIKNISINKIHPNIKNPRTKYDKSDIEELSNSMKTLGQITPIKIDERGYILGGHRRYLVAKKLGWKNLKAITFKNLTELEKSAILISDNATNKKFNAWDIRASINDIYWNEFVENYQFKSENDKGYSQFANLIGISSTMVKKL